MNRRGFLRAGGAALGLSALKRSRLDAGAQTRPNILVIMVDQMRFPIPTTMPDNPSRPSIASLTPNITKLCSVGSKTITSPQNPSYNPGSGTSFTNYFGAATACSPARAAMVTGLYAPQTRMYVSESTDGNPPLNAGFPTWGTILTDSTGAYGFQTLGYKTAWIGKWHLSSGHGSTQGLVPYGFSYNWPSPSPNGLPNEGANGGLTGYGPTSSSYKNDAQIAGVFENWLTANGESTPWCATVSFVNPHDIQPWPLSFAQILDPSNAALDMQALLEAFTIAFPITTSFPTGGFTGSVYDGYFSQGPLANGIPNYEDIQSLAAAGVKPELQAQETAARMAIQGLRNPDGTIQPVSDQMFARLMDMYLWLWAMVDAEVGKVLNTLWANAGLANNTIIVFTSDHGEFGGAHGMTDKEGALYDEGIHVPLYIWFPYALQNPSKPSNYQGTRSNLSSAVDFCPFLLTLASGSDNWRSQPALAHLKNRQSLLDFLFQAKTGSYVRPYILATSDELLVDEVFNPIAAPGVARHVIAYRDLNGKYCQYSSWIPCTDTIDNTQPQFFEFYDYVDGDGGAGNPLELNNDIATSPNASPYAGKFAAAVAAEFVLPPPNLAAPYAAALPTFVSWTERSLGACST